jgi:hypothetical protein
VHQQNTLPGTLLAVAGAFQKFIGDQEVPKGYTNYEGLHIKFEERIVMVLSDTVLDAIYAAGREIVLSYAWKLYDINRDDLGVKVEDCFLKDLNVIQILCTR